MATKFATADEVGLSELLDFVRPRHRMVLTTFRADGSLQSSPVTGGVDDEGRLVISSYPQRAKCANIRRTPRASVVVLSDEFNGAYVQVDGDAEVIDLPDAVEPLVDYYRAIAGMRTASSGDFERAAARMPNAAQRLLRSAELRKLVDVPRVSFESMMRKRARTALAMFSGKV